MQVRLISYHRTIPTGSYANEKIGVEIELSEGDKPEEVFLQAKQLVEDFHVKSMKEQEAMMGSYSSPMQTPFGEVKPLNDAPPKPLTPAERKQAQIQSTIQQIKEITDPVVLKTFEKLAISNPDTKKAYETRLKQLTDQ